MLDEALRSPHYRAYLQTTGRAGAAVRLFRLRPLCRPACRQLSDRAAAPEDRRHAGAPPRHRRRGDPVRHARRKHRPRRASRVAGGSAEVPLAHRLPAGAESRRSWRCARKARSRAATAICCSARRNWRWRPSRASPSSLSIPPPGRSRTRSMPIRISPPISSPRSASGMEGLVEDAGYAALLGAFGPALLDPTGSRPVGAADRRDGRRRAHPPSARTARNPEQRDSAAAWLVREHAAGHRPRGGAASRDIRRHAREQPAVPPRAGSRDARAGAFRHRGAARGDRTLDPGTWLDRAAQARHGRGRREALVAVARALERLDIWAAGAVDVPAHPGGSSGAARGLAGRAAHGGARECCCTRCGWR